MTTVEAAVPAATMRRSSGTSGRPCHICMGLRVRAWYTPHVAKQRTRGEVVLRVKVLLAHYIHPL